MKKNIITLSSNLIKIISFTFMLTFSAPMIINAQSEKANGSSVSSPPTPPYSKSQYIIGVTLSRFRFHKGDGDMWPITWAADGNLYGAAGDNMDSPMNFWKISGPPIFKEFDWPGYNIELVNNLPFDPLVYCKGRLNVDPKNGIKPASLLSIGGILYFAVENMNYGDNPKFNRQHNINSWIATSKDFGKTWEREATPENFFTGRLASPHFLQFGKDYEGARDEFVYAYFPAADDGNSYWENGDYILLGRVPKEKILQRDAWKFFTGTSSNEQVHWSSDDRNAQPVFRYPSMTGENHVSYNKGLKRYLMGNYGFLDLNGNIHPYHHAGRDPFSPSQLTIYEAPEPWGPWTLFYQDDNWGTYGDYQPNFPTKWMSEDGKTIWMVSAGTFDDYNFTLQRLTLTLKHE